MPDPGPPHIREIRHVLTSGLTLLAEYFLWGLTGYVNNNYIPDQLTTAHPDVSTDISVQYFLPIADGIEIRAVFRDVANSTRLTGVAIE